MGLFHTARPTKSKFNFYLSPTRSSSQKEKVRKNGTAFERITNFNHKIFLNSVSQCAINLPEVKPEVVMHEANEQMAAFRYLLLLVSFLCLITLIYNDSMKLSLSFKDLNNFMNLVYEFSLLAVFFSCISSLNH